MPARSISEAPHRGHDDHRAHIIDIHLFAKQRNIVCIASKSWWWTNWFRYAQRKRDADARFMRWFIQRAYTNAICKRMHILRNNLCFSYIISPHVYARTKNHYYYIYAMVRTYIICLKREYNFVRQITLTLFILIYHF